MSVEHEIKIEARLIALEQVLSRTYMMVCHLGGITDPRLSEIEKDLIETASKQAVATDHPEWSDHFVAEIERATEDLLQKSREFREARAGQSGGKTPPG